MRKFILRVALFAAILSFLLKTEPSANSEPPVTSPCSFGVLAYPLGENATITGQILAGTGGPGGGCAPPEYSITSDEDDCDIGVGQPVGECDAFVNSPCFFDAEVTSSPSSDPAFRGRAIGHASMVGEGKETGIEASFIVTANLSATATASSGNAHHLSEAASATAFPVTISIPFIVTEPSCMDWQVGLAHVGGTACDIAEANLSYNLPGAPGAIEIMGGFNKDSDAGVEEVLPGCYTFTATLTFKATQEVCLGSDSCTVQFIADVSAEFYPQ